MITRIVSKVHRRLSLVLLVVVLAFSTLLLNFSSLKAAEELTINGFIMEILEETDTYQKIKITYQETEEIEYLEVKSNNGKTEYYSEINRKKTKIAIGEPKKVKKAKEDASTNGGQWIYQYSMYGSGSLESTTVGGIAGILASIAGLNEVTSVILSIATTLYGLAAPNVWYEIQRFAEFGSNGCHIRDITLFFAYPDYTNLLGSEENQFRVCR